MRIRRLDQQLVIAAPAKVNLFLELHGKRTDGFHEIETLMQSVSLFDGMRFQRVATEGCSLAVQLFGRGRQTRETDWIPADDRNLVLQALSLMRREAQAENSLSCQSGIHVELLKRIPSAAGLGGASSNAAAALIAGNELWGLNWGLERLECLAAQLGSDIPFFLTGGAALSRGRGEQISSWQCPVGLPMVIVKPAQPLATARVFGEVRPTRKTLPIMPAARALAVGKRNLIAARLFNRLQAPAEKLCSQVGALRGEFQKLPCLGHQMTGSGSSYFGVFATRRVAQRAARVLRARCSQWRVFLVHSLGGFQWGPRGITT